MDFDNDLTSEIVKRADIVKIIGSFIELEKKGNNYVGICPFHDDTHPSMSVSPQLKMFKCFVCGTAGSCITFVQKYLHISYREAMIKVAEMIGYDDPRLKKTVYVKPVDETKKPLYACLHDLTLYYQYALNTPEGKDGLEYFTSRNIDTNLIEKYKLGYAPKDGKKTIAFLQSKGHSLKTIEDIGVASISEKDNHYADKNQGRVIFPIIDIDNNVIGYSARRIKDGDEAKYVNSPETALFHKSNVLYNINIAKESCRKTNCIYLVEGFMDVYALSKIGFDNAVAIMGTALTKEHIQILKSLNVEVRLCLDGDLPGQTAMMKINKMLASTGISYSIVNNVGSSLDPDEIYQTKGGEELNKYLNNLMSSSDFALQYYTNSNPLQTADQKHKFVEEFMPVLLSCKTGLELDSYLRRLSKVTGYEYESIKQLYIKMRSAKTVEESKTIIESYHPENKILKRLQLAERELLYQMLQNKEAIDFYEKEIGGFSEPTYRTIANYLIEYASTHDSTELIDVITSIENSGLENTDALVKEVTQIFHEKNHINQCGINELNGLLATIKEEKNKIFEHDNLENSLMGKSELEKARIIAEYNRKKMKKM